jgi:hypothetical protein
MGILQDRMVRVAVCRVTGVGSPFLGEYAAQKCGANIFHEKL